MKKIAAVLSLGLLVTIAAYLQESRTQAQAQITSAASAAQMPSLDQILEKYVQALGGRASFEKLTSRVTVQSVLRPDGEARMEIYEKAPNKRLIVTRLGRSGDEMTGYDGHVGWSYSTGGRARELQNQELANLKQTVEFYRELKFKEVFPQATLKGVEMILGRSAYRVETPTPDGLIEKIFFDAQSGLLIRRVRQTTIFVREDDADPGQSKVIDLIYDYTDYREVDGVKLPFLMQRRGLFDTTTRVKEIKHNVAIDDAKFKQPAS